MKKYSTLAFILAALVFASCALFQKPQYAGAPVYQAPVHPPLPSAPYRVGPDFLYPNPQLTPGKADTLNPAELAGSYRCPPRIHRVYCTYSQAHRYESAQERRAVYDEYNVPAAERNTHYGEVDHLYPICAGGSNDLANLWYEPASSEWHGENFGYHKKDVLEAYICEQIKAGRLDPADAYQKITTDWVAYYQELGLDQRARYYK